MYIYMQAELEQTNADLLEEHSVLSEALQVCDTHTHTQSHTTTHTQSHTRWRVHACHTHTPLHAWYFPRRRLIGENENKN